MMQTVTKDKLFKSTMSKAFSKADQTRSAAQKITDEETAKRKQKTERLRALRLAKKTG